MRKVCEVRIAIAILLVSFVPRASVSQIQVHAWTSEPAYLFGDTVLITIIAYNPTPDTIVLAFSSSFQVSYTIDNFSFIQHIACLQVLTARTIPPFASIAWGDLRYPYPGSGWPVLTVGQHTLTGEVLGYGTSDTLVFPVLDRKPYEINFKLIQNYPNPFNGSTRISYFLKIDGHVLLTLHNNLGQQVRTLLDTDMQAGSYWFQAQLADLPTGAYWCRLQMGGQSQTIKILLTK